MRGEITKQKSDQGLLKDMTRMIHRIERLFVPAESVTENDISQRLDNLLKKVKRGEYFEDIPEFMGAPKVDSRPTRGGKSKGDEFSRKVNLTAFETDLVEQMQEHTNKSDPTASVGYILPPKVQEEIDIEKTLQSEKISKAIKRDRLQKLTEHNDQPVMQGKWRKIPYAPRTYDKVCKFPA